MTRSPRIGQELPDGAVAGGVRGTWAQGAGRPVYASGAAGWHAQRGLRSSDRDAAASGMRPGELGHFTVPVTADGKVIVADQACLDIYGMLQG